MQTYFVWRMDGYGALYRVIDTVTTHDFTSALRHVIATHGEEDIAVTLADTKQPTYYASPERVITYRD